MTKLNIVVDTDEQTGILVGWLKDKPGVISEAKTYSELVESIIEAKKIFEEAEKDFIIKK